MSDANIIIDDDNAGGSYDMRENYDGTCITVVTKLLKIHSMSYVSEFVEYAVFVPVMMFEQFQMDIVTRDISLADDQICDTGLIQFDNHRQFGVKRGFSFLQPNYLSYMEKPFTNPDAITQVNLILDYHRTQKRRRGREIFNICDLIAFKMAIDDNRFEYENCEFHKIIDRTLVEYIDNGLYMNDNKFDFKEYLADKHDYRLHLEIFEYLVYHFQKTIGSVTYNSHGMYSFKVSTVTNIPEFLDMYSRNKPKLIIRETDTNGKCSEVLYEIVLRSANEMIFIFELDCEWIYSGDGSLNQIPSEPLANCAFSITTKNSYNFIENFVNWIKLVFGTRAKDFIVLRLENFETINPYIFNDFHIMELHFFVDTLEYKLIKMLKQSKHEIIRIWECRIANDINQRIEFTGLQSARNQNIFAQIDELQNVGDIILKLEEHTIGTIFDYVASAMTVNKLTKFQFKNKIVFSSPQLKNSKSFRFMRSGANTDFDRIDACTPAGGRIDFYELLNDVNYSERHEFSFYE